MGKKTPTSRSPRQETDRRIPHGTDDVALAVEEALALSMLGRSAEARDLLEAARSGLRSPCGQRRSIDVAMARVLLATGDQQSAAQARDLLSKIVKGGGDDGWRASLTLARQELDEGDGAWLLELDGDTPGSRTTRLPPLPGDTPFEPHSWSADGRRIAGTARGIVVHDLEGRSYARLSDHGRNPVWVGSGPWLLFVEGNAIHRIDSRSGKADLLLKIALSRLLPFLGISPEGGFVYYSAVALDDEIWLLDPDG